MNNQRLIRLYAAGLLDPDDAADLEDRLAASASLRAALRGIRAEPVEAPPRSPWRVPPPGWGAALRVQTPAVLGPGRVRAGEAFHIDLDELPDAAEREVVVLRQQAGRWEVLAPEQPDDRARLSDFPLVEGRRRVTLLARGVGPQRWAVALPVWEAWAPAETPAARWEALQRAVAEGRVPVGAADLEVLADRSTRRTSLPWAQSTLDSLSDGEPQTAPAPRALAGRYELRSPLGRGGEGQVWRAFDRINRESVAIKLIAATADADLVRVRRELTALRWLQLPGVARLRDDGIEGASYFLVMDLVEGGPFPGLAAPMSWSALRPAALSLLESLARVHLAGVVHRDLKPQNVLMDASGRPVILDFGLAVGEALSPTAERNGLTVRYAAPEQFELEPSTTRTDLYSVGLMFFEALTGRLPQRETDRKSLVSARLYEDPVSLGLLRPDLPGPVIEAIDRLVARRPEDRPASALETLDALGGAGDAVTQGEALGGLPAGRPATIPELRALFQGLDLFSHLAEDGATTLWRRTGGQGPRVNREVAAWVRAGLARWEQGALVVTRPAVNRLFSGLAVDRGAAEEEQGLTVDEASALRWVRFGFPEVTAARLARAAGLSPAEAQATLRRLEVLGLAWPLGEGRWGAQPRLGEEPPAADLSSVLQIFSERSEAQVAALAALHMPLPALLPRIQRISEALLGEGRLAAAGAVLDYGLWLIRLEAPEDPGLLDQEAELLRLLCVASLSEESVAAHDRALYALGRAVGAGEDLDAMGWLLQGARAAWRREPERALAILDNLAPLADEELESWRQAARVRAASAQGLAREEAVLEALSQWAAGSPLRQARLAGWWGNTRYRQGRFEESTLQHRRSAAGKTRPDARLASLVNAAGAAMEALQYDEAEALAARVEAEARALRQVTPTALAVWIQRQVAYRTGRAGPLRPELVEAAVGLGPAFEGLFATTEAAVAWRQGRRAEAAALARRAADRLDRSRRLEGAHLAAALALAASGDAPHEALQALAAEASADPTPSLAAQTLGLLCAATPNPDPAWRALATARAQAQPLDRWALRLDVLSMDEATGQVPIVLEKIDVMQ